MKNLFRRILSVINNGDEFGEKEGLRKRKTGKRSQWQQQGERKKKKEGKLRVHSYFTIREIKKQKPSIGRGEGEARTFFCNRSVNNKNAVARGGSHSSPLCASRFKKKKKGKIRQIYFQIQMKRTTSSSTCKYLPQVARK